MSYDGTGGGSDQVSEPGLGHAPHKRRATDGGRGSQGARELGDPRGAELERRRSRDPHRDAQASEAEVVPPPAQQVLPGFEATAYFRSGPIPSAAELAEYDRFMPGVAREIVSEAHANMASDRRINELRVQTASKLDIRGQAFAFVLCTTCIVFALMCLFLLHPAWLAASGAGIFALGAIAPVINAFLQRGGPKEEDDNKSAPQPPASPDGD